MELLYYLAACVPLPILNCFTFSAHITSKPNQYFLHSMESNVENESNESRCEVEAQRSIVIGGLPRELFLDILSRLPITSLMDCKLVSQIWHSSAKHPLSISMHLSRVNRRNPFLLCFSDYPVSKLDAVDLSSPDNNTFVARTLNFPSELMLPCFDVVGSCNGLLCIYNRARNDPLFIYNPFTREFKELPELINPTNLKVVRVNFGFGFHPRTKEYKVIKLVYYTEGNNIFTGAIKKPEVYVLTLGDSEWRHKGQKPFRLSCMASDTLVDGNLHWLTTNYSVEEEKPRDIIAFDLAAEEFQVITQPTGLSVNKFVTHLVALNNCLSVVVSSQGGENEMWELKDYSSKESWTRRLVIPNYVPTDFRINGAPPARSRLNGTRQQEFRVLCTLDGGDEILFSYKNRRLVSFNPDLGGFKDFRIEGLPIEFETIIHVGSLISVDAAFDSRPSRPHHEI